MAKEAKDKEASESSGLADIMEVAEKIGGPADSFAGAGITVAADDDDDDDDLTNLGGGFGGGASAALVAGGDDDDDELPSVAAFAPVALPSADPEPAPKSEQPAVHKKVALVEAPAATPPKAAPKPKARPKDDDAEPVVVAPTRAASTPAPAAAASSDEGGGGSKTWLVLLGLAAAGAAVWFLMRDPAPAQKPPVAAATTPADAPPPEPIAKADPPPIDPVPAVDDSALAVEDASTGAEEQASGGSGEPAAAEAGADAAAEPEDAKADWKTTKKVPRAKKDAVDATKPEPEPKPEPVPEPEPEPEPKPEPKLTQAELDKKFSTECLLDPNKPGCEEFRKRQAAKLKDLDTHLPEKLSQNDIKGGVGSVKSKAKACGSQHGATAGETVRVKLSIEGATGKVLSASAIDDHASTPLGKCVAAALSDATFPRFKSQQQGTTYPVTM